MTPRSFDAATSREMVGELRARAIEAAARADADNGQAAYAPPAGTGALTYWGKCQQEFERQVYLQQFSKRLARNARTRVSTPTLKA